MKLRSLVLALAVALCLALPASALGAAQLPHVTDTVGLLTSSEVEELERQAQDIEDAYGFGVYIVTVDDYFAISSTSIFDAATRVYREYDLGVGEDRDGLLLMLSMYDRDYTLITYGDFGNYAFSDEGRAAMTEFFLDDFANDAWYAGFADYLAWSEDYLEAAKAGEPYGSSSVPVDKGDVLAGIGMYLVAILVIPLIIAFVAVRVMDRKMQSVALATHAFGYVTEPLQLTGQQDQFSHVTEVAVPIVKVESGGGGGPMTFRGGGFSGTSGKF